MCSPFCFCSALPSYKHSKICCLPDTPENCVPQTQVPRFALDPLIHNDDMSDKSTRRLKRSTSRKKMICVSPGDFQFMFTSDVYSLNMFESRASFAWLHCMSGRSKWRESWAFRAAIRFACYFEHLQTWEIESNGSVFFKSAACSGMLWLLTVCQAFSGSFSPAHKRETLWIQMKHAATISHSWIQRYSTDQYDIGGFQRLWSLNSFKFDPKALENGGSYICVMLQSSSRHQSILHVKSDQVAMSSCSALSDSTGNGFVLPHTDSYSMQRLSGCVWKFGLRHAPFLPISCAFYISSKNCLSVEVPYWTGHINGRWWWVSSTIWGTRFRDKC